jgi:hypothetical protein
MNTLCNGDDRNILSEAFNDESGKFAAWLSALHTENATNKKGTDAIRS